jgi:D-glycero-D-manno-heptose 1,7-bisphosphate phosphatase
MTRPAGPERRRAAFLDRDGVINVDHGYVVRREDFSFVPGVLDGARRLRKLGFTLVVVTNQSGIGRGLYSAEAFEQLTAWMKAQFESAGAPLAGVYFCPHHPTEATSEFRRTCDCRKPAPGMLLAAAQELGLDLGASVLFGDKHSDLLAARAAGVPERVLLGTDGAARPAAPAPNGLATALFRRLDDALSDPSLLAALGASGTVSE